VPEPRDHSHDHCFEWIQSLYISAKALNEGCEHLQQLGVQSTHINSAHRPMAGAQWPMDWENPYILLPILSPGGILPKDVIGGIVTNVRQVMGQENGTALGISRKEDRIKQCSTAIDACIV